MAAENTDPRSTTARVEPPIFADRQDAGRRLASALAATPLGDAVVVGLAWGGVPVAAEVAARLAAPLDVAVVRKVGRPLQPELALGAVTAAGQYYVAPIAEYEPAATLRAGFWAAVDKARQMEGRLREEIPPVDLHGRVCILVDDGLATGATMRAAIRWARSRGAGRIVVAVPVAARESVSDLRDEADEVVCPHAVNELWAVGLWYRDFSQVAEEEVLSLLRRSRASGPRPAREAAMR